MGRGGFSLGFIAGLVGLLGLAWASGPAVIEARHFRVERDYVKALVETLSGEQREMLRADPLKRARFLRHLAEVEALSRRAYQEGLDRDPRVRRRLEFMAKEYLARRWLEQEVARRMKAFHLSEKDLRLYYQTHPEEFRNPDGKEVPFEKARALIREKLREEHRRALVEEIVKEVLSQEKVRFHPNQPLF